MMDFLSTRRGIIIWQVLFLILGTTWLWAPHLNNGLSYRTSLISQYETSFQPYSWLFRAGDLLAGALLLLFAYQFTKSSRQKIGWLLIVISLGLILDPLLGTTCKTVGSTCQEYFSISFLFHAVETITTSTFFFLIAAFDVYKRRKLVSISFVVFQVLYGLLFLSQWAHNNSFNTATQFMYETILIIWLAWFCRDSVAEPRFSVTKNEMKFVKNLAAAWAFLNGVLAITVSLAHISLFGKIKGLYFTGDSAWLAQHGVIVGVIMLYLSRHLARGERRARQIFIAITGAEALKYAVISPHLGLMLFYLATFIALFVLRDDFDRGTISLTWRIRLRDLYVLLSGLLVSVFVSLLLLDRDDRLSVITTRALGHLGDYTLRNPTLMHHRHLESILLAHSITVFLVTSLAAILWVLFRPYGVRRTAKDWSKIEQTLSQHSSSTEDYFKRWPHDKDYFWGQAGHGFVAYKVAGSIAFGLADPIGHKPNLLLEEFNDWSRQRRLSVCYLPVYPKSLPMNEQAGLQTMQIGSSAVINIDKFLTQTSKDKWWRWRINKSKKSNYDYKVSQPPHSDALIKDLKKVSDAWLGFGGHVERNFALGYFDKKYMNHCVLHYLLDDKQKPVAFVNLLPQFKPSRMLTIDLMRQLPGTDAMPFVIYKTIETCKEQYDEFDLGFVPFAKTEEPLLLAVKALSGDKFSAKGLEQFKSKFDPTWHNNYMAYDGDLGDLAAITINIEKVMKLKN